MASFRFEYFENVITKHHLKKVTWQQAALSAFSSKLDNNKASIESVRQIDEDTIEIVKRITNKKNWLYKLGLEQYGVKERVIINRKEKSVAIDRMDIQWRREGPFVGRRDLFLVNNDEENKLNFIRHDLWVSKLLKIDFQLMSNYAAWRYRRAFKAVPTA